VHLIDQLLGITQRAILGSDVGIVGYIIAEIALRRFEKGGAPDGLKAEALDIVELPDDALYITDTVTIGIII
jgi:hypothetical protein